MLLLISLIKSLENRTHFCSQSRKTTIAGILFFYAIWNLFAFLEQLAYTFNFWVCRNRKKHSVQKHIKTTTFFQLRYLNLSDMLMLQLTDHCGNVVKNKTKDNECKNIFCGKCKSRFERNHKSSDFCSFYFFLHLPNWIPKVLFYSFFAVQWAK